MVQVILAILAPEVLFLSRVSYLDEVLRRQPDVEIVGVSLFPRRSVLLLRADEWDFARIYKSVRRLGGPKEALYTLRCLCEEATLAYIKACEQGTEHTNGVRSSLNLRYVAALQLATAIVKAEEERLRNRELTKVKIKRGHLHDFYRLKYSQKEDRHRQLEEIDREMKKMPLYHVFFGPNGVAGNGDPFSLPPGAE